MGGDIGGDIVRGAADVMTFGTNELAGNPAGKMYNSLFNNKSPSAVMAGGTMSPMEMLTTSGGAPLLTNIALGVKPDDALASFFGVSPDKWQDYVNGLTPSEQQSIKGLSSQLNEISTNTDMRNQAVTKLVNDFPDYMASAIPKYKGIIDTETQAAADQALKNVASKYAAGGGLSSGAMAAATARTAATTAQGNTESAINLAGQDWMQKFNAASALRTFQQKMLGQGAEQGFNAVQYALAGNRQVGEFNANATNTNNQNNQNKENAMWGSLGMLGATALLGPAGKVAAATANSGTAPGAGGASSFKPAPPPQETNMGWA